MIYYTVEMFTRDIELLSGMIKTTSFVNGHSFKNIFGVPRGGIPLATALSQKLFLPLTGNPGLKTLVVDDVVDSGRTRSRFKENQFASIHIKKHTPESLRPQFYLYQVDQFINYFWETNESTIEDHILRILEYVGENPTGIRQFSFGRKIVCLYKLYKMLWGG
jgi:hypothetical protein